MIQVPQLNQNLFDREKLEQKPARDGLNNFQDEVFKKMSAEQKLLLLDEFFNFGKELQNLNDRRKI